MENFIIVALFILGLVVGGMALTAISLREERAKREAYECACLEFIGDNEACPVHSDLAKYLASDPAARERSERAQAQQMEAWGGHLNPCNRSNTSRTRSYLRRRPGTH